MIDNRTAPYGVFGLRLVLGSLFLIHASVKLFVFTPAGTAHFFAAIGLPPALAYFVILWELVGGVALILGLWPRLASLAMVPDLLGAIFTVHGAAGFFFTNPNGGWDYPALWIVGRIAVALIADGAFALAPTPVPGAVEDSNR